MSAAPRGPVPTGLSACTAEHTTERTTERTPDLASARRTRVRAIPLLRPTAGSDSSNSLVGHWELLMGAVTARLRDTVGVSWASAAAPRSPQAVAQVQASVRECAAALDQLKGAMQQELQRCHVLERQLGLANEALAQAKADLLGTQDGERRARHLALHDGLTELPNRSFFRERLDQALAPAAAPGPALALLYLDLDGFKPINDMHGHEAGDALLRIVAARLSRAVRAEDMVGRLGGDEFGCLLGGLLNREQLGQLACKLFDAVSAPLCIGELQLTVRPSIGIAVCPGDGATAEQLLKHADAAMYRAKRHRSGYAFFDGCVDA